MNVPQLRFDGFDGEWEKKRFYECVEIQGKLVDPKKEEYKNLPHIGPGNIAKFTGQLLNYKLVKNEELISGKFEFNHQDVVYSKIRPELNKVVFPEFSGLCSADAYPLRAIEGMMEPYFLFQQLMSPKFIKFSISVSMRTGMPKINRDELASFTFHVPKIAEQKKISEFFRLLNLKVQKQQEKIEKLERFKKSMMQKVFSQELRFRDEDGEEFPEWEENVKAREIFKSISNKNHAGHLPVLSASQEKGIVMRDSNNIQIQFSIDNLVNYKKVEPNDFVISLRSFQGGIEYSHLLGIMSPAYTIFRAFDEEKIHPPYFSFIFKTTDFITRLNNLTYGIRDGKAISFTDFSTMTFNVPNSHEQIKIAEYLSGIDRKIQKEKEKLMVLEEQKKGFMQGMFV